MTNINTDLSDEKFIKIYSERVIAFSGYAVCIESLHKRPTNLRKVTLSVLITLAQSTLSK